MRATACQINSNGSRRFHCQLGHNLDLKCGRAHKYCVLSLWKAFFLLFGPRRPSKWNDKRGGGCSGRGTEGGREEDKCTSEQKKNTNLNSAQIDIIWLLPNGYLLNHTYRNGEMNSLRASVSICHWHTGMHGSLTQRRLRTRLNLNLIFTLDVWPSSAYRRSLSPSHLATEIYVDEVSFYVMHIQWTHDACLVALPEWRSHTLSHGWLRTVAPFRSCAELRVGV